MYQRSELGFSHLLVFPPQGKDDFERQQKELLEKENIIKQSQVQLGQEQVRLPQTLLHLSIINIYILYRTVRYTQLLTFWGSRVQRVWEKKARAEGDKHLDPFVAARWHLKASLYMQYRQ